MSIYYGGIDFSKQIRPKTDWFNLSETKSNCSKKSKKHCNTNTNTNTNNKMLMMHILSFSNPDITIYGYTFIITV